jgi:hypothetical protein
MYQFSCIKIYMVAELFKKEFADKKRTVAGVEDDVVFRAFPDNQHITGASRGERSNLKQMGEKSQKLPGSDAHEAESCE